MHTNTSLLAEVNVKQLLRRHLVSRTSHLNLMHCLFHFSNHSLFCWYFSCYTKPKFMGTLHVAYNRAMHPATQPVYSLAFYSVLSRFVLSLHCSRSVLWFHPRWPQFWCLSEGTHCFRGRLEATAPTLPGECNNNDALMQLSHLTQANGKYSVSLAKSGLLHFL